MIPKVIYCFLEGGKKPQLVRKCIASCSRVMPDWKIKEWNASNWNVSQYAFAEETARISLWAFVSDVARWDILYREGGTFLDTDMELIKPIDELSDANWIAAECDNPLRANPGLWIAISKGSTFAKMRLDVHLTLVFDLSRKFDFAFAQTVTPYLSRPDAPRVYPQVYFDPSKGSGGLESVRAALMRWRKRIMIGTLK